MFTDLPMLLRVDGAANLAGGLLLALLAESAAGLLGLGPVWPTYAAAVLLALYGVEQLVTARDPGSVVVGCFAAVDLGLGLALVVLAAGDPTGAENAARWGLVVVGDLSLLVGALKLAGVRRRQAGGPSHQSRTGATA